jgi:hypothetical protein
VSELIKRIAFLTGHRSEPFSVEAEKSIEELLADWRRSRHGANSPEKLN